MMVYSRCRTCGGALLLGRAPDCDAQKSPYWHDSCDPKPTRMERLCEDLRDMLSTGIDEEHPDVVKLTAQIDQLAGAPPRLADAAIRYAEWGWPVHPLKPRSKEPNSKHGFADATSDVDRIRRWWKRHPDDNIGLATGHRFDVIDVDVPKYRKSGEVTPSGFVVYTQLLSQEDSKLPDCHGMALTPSGGLHLFVKSTGQSNRGGVAPGIDIRGKGGYVVAAPSILDPVPTLRYPGGRYSWTYVPSPELIDG